MYFRDPTSLTIRHNRRVSEGYNKRGREPSTRYERAPKALIKITNGKSARVSAALAETSPARLVIQPPISISRHASRTLREEDLLRINDNYMYIQLSRRLCINVSVLYHATQSKVLLR